MASADELKQRIDLHDLADRLGLERPSGGQNYRSPHHADKSPSLSIYEKNGQQSWKDFSSDEGGSCIDLVMYVQGLDFSEAMRWLHDEYGIPRSKPDTVEQRQRTWPEQLADICTEKGKDLSQGLDYLRSRGLSDEILQRAVAARAIGFNDYRNPKKEEGTHGHGGPGVAFITRRWSDNQVVAVDQRYLAPDLNGGVKSNCQGERAGVPWFLTRQSVKAAHTVYIVESPINALSVMDCGLPKGTVAVAARGVTGLEHVDWSFLRGKKVVICMDNDEPNEKGHRPGTAAAWTIYDQLVELLVPAMLVDQDAWEHNDCNDILMKEGRDELRMALRRFSPWIIPGQCGDEELRKGAPRVFLPGQDLYPYWRFRAKPDFVTWIDKIVKEDGGQEKQTFADVCGFRVADLSRISVQGAQATLTGDEDHAPHTVYAVTVQTALDDKRLVRRVLDDELVHNLDQWRRFGPIYKAPAFARMLNILYRTAEVTERRAANFVGLCWREGKLAVSHGPDCYFTAPEKQCPYHNLVWPSGSKADARAVVEAYQATFDKNAAAIPLVWIAGAHLKVVLGFWPHFVIQAEKETGKTTLLKRLERTMAFTVFSNESLKTPFRLLTTVSHTSHPVGWDEISANRKQIIDEAITMLQQTYQYNVTRRGNDMTEYLQSAPVFLTGEEVDADTLQGKVVRSSLTLGGRGDRIREDLPLFPMREWLEYLASMQKETIRAKFDKALQYLKTKSLAATDKKSGTVRMVENYAALVTGWSLLCEFAGIPSSQGQFITSAIEEMNAHIKETTATRQPWVWIIQAIINEIAANQYRAPWDIRTSDDTGLRMLVIKPQHIMHHLASTMSLRATFDALPIKKSSSLMQQLQRAEVICQPRVDATIGAKRYSHMVGLSIEALELYQLHVPEPETVASAEERQTA